MSRLLITSIGTGQPDIETRTVKYRPARYTDGIDGKEVVETAYVMDAVSHFEKIDKIIVVGTAGSDWFSFYEHLRKLTDTPLDNDVEEVQLRLLDYHEEGNKSRKSPDDIQILIQPVKKLLGKLYPGGADIIVLKYGLNESELQENFRYLQAVGSMAEDKDEIIFDITHAFRSLAFFELITVNYIREVQGKDVTIQKVTYGMFDAARDLKGNAPVVDLRPLIDTMDCMKAIDEFQRFGTTYALCDLIEKMDNSDLSKEERKALRGLSENISSNNFDAFRRLVRSCHKVIRRQDCEGIPVNDKYSQIEEKEDTNVRMIANKIYREIDGRFYEALDDDFLLQIEFARWHFDKKRYIVASVTLIEALIGFAVVLCEGKNEIDNREFRDIYRSALNKGYGNGDSCAVKFLHYWNELRHIRNHFAHPVDEKQIESDIAKWKKITPELILLYKEAYMNQADSEIQKNREVLKKILKNS